MIPIKDKYHSVSSNNNRIALKYVCTGQASTQVSLFVVIFQISSTNYVIIWSASH